MELYPEIPAIGHPPLGSIAAFVAVILFVVLWLVVSVCISGEGIDKREDRRRVALFVTGLLAWLVLGAVLPMSGLLHWKVMPPPGLVFAVVCFVVGAIFTFSRIGTRLVSLPVYWLIGVHVFRLPLELILHRWYVSGTIPVQMTFEGYNFDIATGVIALVVGRWAKYASPPKFIIWFFNVVGLLLLLTVVSIAITSVPTPFRQFTNEPPLLLPFYFPYSYIVSIAVTGALVAHLVLFRKLVESKQDHPSTIEQTTEGNHGEN